MTKLLDIFKKILSKKQRKKGLSKGLSNVTRSEMDYANAILIDRIARVIFPLSWFTFLLIYFFYLIEAHKTIYSEDDSM